MSTFSNKDFPPCRKQIFVMVRSILLIFLVLTLSEIFALLNSLLHLPLSFLTVDILLLKTGSLDACIASKKFFF